MKSRSLGVGLLALASSLTLLVGTASAHGTAAPEEEPPATCTIESANDVVMPWMVEDPIMPSRPTMEVSAVAPWSVLARTEMMQERGK